MLRGYPQLFAVWHPADSAHIVIQPVHYSRRKNDHSNLEKEKANGFLVNLVVA